MSTKPLTEAESEGIIKRTVNAIFAAVANKRMDSIRKQMMRDPEFKASVERLEKIRIELEAQFAKTYKKDPRYKEFRTNYEKSYGKD